MLLVLCLLEQRGVTELVDIEPLHVAAYVEALQETAAKPLDEVERIQI